MLPALPIILLGALPELENDCACPTPPASRRLRRLAGGLYRCAPHLHSQRLDDEWSLFVNPLAGGPPAVLNAAAQARLSAFTTPRALADDDDTLLATAGLVEPPGSAGTTPEYAPSTLTAWLHVTNACNLECPYCYVRKSGAHMPFEVGVRAVEALITTARRHGFTTLKLKYAGGEAPLHFKMIQRLHAYAQERAAAAGLGLRAVVLSNGTLITPAFAAWLATSGVRLMLSVDGVGAAHDEQRPWRGRGQGAFAALEHNLAHELLPRGVRPDVCVTLTGRNAHLAHQVVRWAIERDLPFSLNFYREHEHAASHRELRFEERQLIDGMLAAYAVVEELLPERPCLDGLLDRTRASAHSHTCGVGQSYVVITHTGQVAQCQMELGQGQPFAADDDLIPLVAAGPIHNVSVDAKEGCRTCLWRHQCAGGCPLLTFRATGRFDIQSPNCAITLALLPAAMRLEALRILKWQLPLMTA